MNKIVEATRIGNITKLIQARAPVTGIAGGDTGSAFADLEINKMLVKSIEVNCNKNIRFSVLIYEEGTTPWYVSGVVDGRLLDVLDFPYVAPVGTTSMKVMIQNIEDPSVIADFSIEVRGFELR